MDKDKILAEAKAELERHVWGTFVEGKESVIWKFYRLAEDSAPPA